MAIATFVAAPRLLTTVAPRGGPLFALPRGVVTLLAALAAVTFLVEGAMLDWSALLISGSGLLPVNQAGVGYAVFAIAMTCGRLTGDAVAERVGDGWLLAVGGIVAVGGFVLLLASPSVVSALIGFALIGLGAANVVPVYFRRAGTQKAMPPALAVYCNHGDRLCWPSPRSSLDRLRIEPCRIGHVLLGDGSPDVPCPADNSRSGQGTAMTPAPDRPRLGATGHTRWAVRARPVQSDRPHSRNHKLGGRAEASAPIEGSRLRYGPSLSISAAIASIIATSSPAIPSIADMRPTTREATRSSTLSSA